MYEGIGGHTARKRNIRHLAGVLSTALIVCVCILGFAGTAKAQAWDIDPPLPGGDPQWEKVKTLYANHYGGKNLTELIAVLTPLKDKYSNSIEPYLWLARVHYLQARYERKDCEDNFEKAETYAAQACQMDPKNPMAVKMLVDALIYNRDRSYIFSHYGALLKSCAPLPSDDALPSGRPFSSYG